jgi:hypothetical protein
MILLLNAIEIILFVSTEKLDIKQQDEYNQVIAVSIKLKI